MNMQEYRQLRAELSALDKLLEKLPESAVIDRMSLTARRSQVTKTLAAYPKPTRWPLDAHLTPSGKSLDPKKIADAHYNCGNAYFIQSDFDRAIQDYSETIKLNPHFADAYNNRGNAYGNKGNFEQAIKDYSKAIELKPDLAEAYYNRGVAYGIKGELDRAIQDFDKAIELKPDYADAYFNRGLTWLHLDEWEKVKADLTTVKNMDVDIAAMFRLLYGSVADFEQRYDLMLPEDIAALVQEKFQTTQDLLDAADQEFAVGNALPATERLWDAVRHTLTTIAQEKGWPYADEEDLYQVAERLNELDKVGLDFLLSGYSAAQGYPDKVRYGFFDFADGDADDARKVVHCFINLARELAD